MKYSRFSKGMRNLQGSTQVDYSIIAVCELYRSYANGDVTDCSDALLGAAPVEYITELNMLLASLAAT